MGKAKLVAWVKMTVIELENLLPGNKPVCGSSLFVPTLIDSDPSYDFGASTLESPGEETF